MAKAKKPAARTKRRTPKKDWRETFLEELARRGNVSAAVVAAKVGRRTAYDARTAEPEFAKLWLEAEKISVEVMEQEARRRAVEGTLRPVFQGGKRVGQIREYSDTLLIFLLKAHDPKYKDKQQVEHSGAVVQTHIYLPKKGSLNGGDGKPA